MITYEEARTRFDAASRATDNAAGTRDTAARAIAALISVNPDGTREAVQRHVRAWREWEAKHTSALTAQLVAYDDMKAAAK